MSSLGLRHIAIELRHLRYFLAVSEELHFGRAAGRLHMSQPPLSAAIQKLEDESGVRLFDRTSRTVALTAAGQVFTEETRKVLASLDLAVAGARRAGGGELGLRIGFAPYLPTKLLLRFLDGLQERQPKLRAQVKHVLGFEQIRRLQLGELDLGIFASSKDLPMLQTEPLSPGRAESAFLPRDHPLAQKTVLGPDDLVSQTLRDARRRRAAQTNPRVAVWLDGLQQFGYRFRALHAVNELRDCFLAVAAGAGIGLSRLGSHGRGCRHDHRPSATRPAGHVAGHGRGLANAPIGRGQAVDQRSPGTRARARPDLQPTLSLCAKVWLSRLFKQALGLKGMPPAGIEPAHAV